MNTQLAIANPPETDAQATSTFETAIGRTSWQLTSRRARAQRRPEHRAGAGRRRRSRRASIPSGARPRPPHSLDADGAAASLETAVEQRRPRDPRRRLDGRPAGTTSTSCRTSGNDAGQRTHSLPAKNGGPQSSAPTASPRAAATVCGQPREFIASQRPTSPRRSPRSTARHRRQPRASICSGAGWTLPRGGDSRHGRDGSRQPPTGSSEGAEPARPRRTCCSPMRATGASQFQVATGATMSRTGDPVLRWRRAAGARWTSRRCGRQLTTPNSAALGGPSRPAPRCVRRGHQMVDATSRLDEAVERSQLRRRCGARSAAGRG